MFISVSAARTSPEPDGIRPRHQDALLSDPL